MPFGGAQPGAVPDVGILTGQILQLSDTVESLRAEMHEMNAEINRLQRRGQGQHGGGEERDTELVDKKFFNPEPFTQASLFREWKTDFEDFIAGRDKELGKLLEQAEAKKEAIVDKGQDDATINKADKLYRILRKLVVQTEAKNIVTHVPNKNPWEAWRLLVARFDPKNDAFNTKSVRDLLSVKVWKPKTMYELPSKIAQWESEQAEHLRRTGSEVLTDALRRDMLLAMISPELKAQVEAATLLVEEDELDYAKIKRFVTRFVYRQLPPTNGAARDAPADALSRQEPEWKEGDEDVDALGKGPRRDAKGSGKGYGGGPGGAKTGGQGGGKGEDPAVKAGRQCNCCREWGHYGRECMNREKINPVTGKTFGSEYDARRLAKGNPKGGKGGRKGVNGLDEGGGEDDANALDEDFVFSDSALGGWDATEGDFYALALESHECRVSGP